VQLCSSSTNRTIQDFIQQDWQRKIRIYWNEERTIKSLKTY